MSRKKIKRKVDIWNGNDVLKNLIQSGRLNCDEETKAIILGEPCVNVEKELFRMVSNKQITMIEHAR